VGSHVQRLVGLALGVAVASSPRPASAQSSAPAASAELAAGDAAARTKAWDAALTHYQAALQAAPTPRASLGAADALYRLGRLGEAYEAYADVQRTYPKLAAADAAGVAARLKELAGKTGWISVRLAEAGAHVDLDGKTLGVSPVPALVRVAVGTHAVHVVKDGYTPVDAQTEVKADATAVVDVTLVRAATQGHVAVQTTGEALRVLVDGVDVGATPWEGDLPPGTHEVAGRSSTALATPQSIRVDAGGRVAVDLVAMGTAAHLQIRTSDGQGLVTVDGAVKGTGAYSGDVAAGAHAVSVTRDGYQPYQKTVTLGLRETWAETVTLEPIATSGSASGAPEIKGSDRSDGEGVYGGFGLAWMPSVASMGTELDTGCGSLGASSCDTPSPLASGSVFGYGGYTWNPVGFELFLAASADTVQQKATFNAAGGNSGTLPSTAPARTEMFTFARFGGAGAVRVRASYAFSAFRVTAAAGLGLSYKVMLMKRDTAATDGSGLQNTFVPGTVSYLSPGVSAEAALHVRITRSLAFAAGAEFWAENAASGTASPPSPGKVLVSAQPNVLPVTVPTPQYHFASGAQVFLGPFVGLQFGP
jgi:hypothetical protein